MDNESDFEWKLRLCTAKINKEIDLDWSEIVEILGLDVSADHLRKTAYGLIEADKYYRNKIVQSSDVGSDLDSKLIELKKERTKLQVLNLERNRIDRNQAKHELYYEYVGSVCNTLPLPEFKELPIKTNNMEYLLNIADIHYGATFTSCNNTYSPQIAKQRFEFLASYIKHFVDKNNVNKLYIASLGDTIQGCLRVSDLKINDSNIVKATVEVSRLIANFLNTISEYTTIEYYHVPTANHTQIRPLGTKASELADEDLEYVISNYIKDLLRDNSRINVHLVENDQYIEYTINGFNIISGHGHTIKNSKNALKDLCALRNKHYDYAIFGHYHSGTYSISSEGIDNDCEVIIAPSFVGSDPYSDSLLEGAKPSCQIIGFDEMYGRTETYKIFLH